MKKNTKNNFIIKCTIFFIISILFIAVCKNNTYAGESNNDTGIVSEKINWSNCYKFNVVDEITFADGTTASYKRDITSSNSYYLKNTIPMIYIENGTNYHVEAIKSVQLSDSSRTSIALTLTSGTSVYEGTVNGGDVNIKFTYTTNINNPNFVITEGWTLFQEEYYVDFSVNRINNNNPEGYKIVNDGNIFVYYVEQDGLGGGVDFEISTNYSYTTNNEGYTTLGNIQWLFRHSGGQVKAAAFMTRGNAKILIRNNGYKQSSPYCYNSTNRYNYYYDYVCGSGENSYINRPWPDSYISTMTYKIYDNDNNYLGKIKFYLDTATAASGEYIKAPFKYEVFDEAENYEISLKYNIKGNKYISNVVSIVVTEVDNTSEQSSGSQQNQNNNNNNNSNNNSNTGNNSSNNAGNNTSNNTGNNSSNNGNNNNNESINENENNSESNDASDVTENESSNEEKTTESNNNQTVLLFELDDANGVLPSDTGITVEQITDSDLEKKYINNLKEKYPNISGYMLYDISLSTVDGEELHQLDGFIKVSCGMPFKLKENEKVIVCRLNDNNEFVECKSSIEDGLLVFETDHFSTYVLMKVTEDGAGETETSGIDTIGASDNGDDSGSELPIVIVVIVIGLVAGTIFVLWKKGLINKK